MKAKKTTFALAVTVGLVGSGLVWGLNREEPTTTVTEKESVVAVDYESDPNLANNVSAFLNNWVESNKEDLHKMILTNFEELNGSYVYGANLKYEEDRSTIDLGISTLTVDNKLITSYDGFKTSALPLEEVDNGIAIVKYETDQIASVEFRAIEAPLEDLTQAVLGADIAQVNTEDSETVTSSEKKYEDLTSSDWAELALLTSKEFVNKELAPPVFLVPDSDISIKGVLTSNPNYIIAGAVVSTSEGETMLRTLEGDVSLDYAIKEPVLNEPMWLHMLVHDGKVESVTQQVFEGADLNTMLKGVIQFKESSNSRR